MNRRSNFIFIFFLFFFSQTHAQADKDFEISKNLDIYTSLIQQLNLHYVDEFNPGLITKASIDAMLKELDPFTNYYSEAEIEDVRFLQTGKYGGIGASVFKRGNQFFVGSVYPDYPFFKAGIEAGDQLLSIDNESLDNKNMEDISDKLRGASGTPITISFIKFGQSIPQTVTFNREQIETKDVSYFAWIDEKTAYIKLEGFKENAAAEVRSALDSLNKTRKVESLVLDLRNNGGGLLIQAVEIMNLFVDANELIVSTKGKTQAENFQYRTQSRALYPQTKIVVLVNSFSASASEIVAGSMQDIDRGVVMGQKSYGKGLVQKVFPLSYKAQAKITVAKYYIPSGRCIQSMDFAHRDANGKAIQLPDSLASVFYTKNGRKVLDAGGILPDLVLNPADKSIVFTSQNSKYLIFDFANQYVANHPKDMVPENFKLSDYDWDAFVKMIIEDTALFQNLGLSKMEQLVADGKKYQVDIAPEVQSMKQKFMNQWIQNIQSERSVIIPFVEAEIVSRYYFEAGRIRSSISSDSEIKAASDLLNQSEKYHQILEIKKM
jgi:carboxyl-terminal processing protease